MDFRSDNTAGVSPEILAALTAANDGAQSSYGEDDYTKRLDDVFSEIFERPVAVFPLATGTAANSLALAHFTPPWGSVYCHRQSHVASHECGGTEFYSGGAKLVLLDGTGARFSAASLSDSLSAAEIGSQHAVQPAAVSLSQASELGTLYSVAEIGAIADVCRRYKLKLHMDGARFANALVSLDVRPADITWRAGVDVLSFGATKNGAMAAEAVIFFDPAAGRDFLYRRKRGGHLFSKMRFLSAQLLAYLDKDLWLRNARHANRMAVDLAAGLARFPGVKIFHPVEANEIFAEIPADFAAKLDKINVKYHPWVELGPKAGRFVTSFRTDPADIVTLLTNLAE